VPLSYRELKQEEAVPDSLMQVHRLEQSEDLLLAALTPTDVFNYAGETAVGDTELSRLAVETAIIPRTSPTGVMILRIWTGLLNWPGPKPPSWPQASPAPPARAR